MELKGTNPELHDSRTRTPYIQREIQIPVEMAQRLWLRLRVKPGFVEGYNTTEIPVFIFENLSSSGLVFILNKYLQSQGIWIVSTGRPDWRFQILHDDLGKGYFLHAFHITSRHSHCLVQCSVFLPFYRWLPIQSASD